MSLTLPYIYDFGPFRLDARQHHLSRQGRVVPLTPKAFETLLVLVRNCDQLVEKDELLKRVWPNSFVEEGTLAQNIFTLRKALGGNTRSGEKYITTIPTRGYRFTAFVTEPQDGNAKIKVKEFTAAPQSRTGYAPLAKDKAIRSIAVLPLVNTSMDADAEFFSDGITESIINSLSLSLNLQVKAFSTVVSYKRRKIDPQTAGHELGVGAVLVGTIRQSDKTLMIKMELVDVVNGWQLWGEQFEEKLWDAFQIQDAIAKKISARLRSRLKGIELKRLFILHSKKIDRIASI